MGKHIYGCEHQVGVVEPFGPLRVEPCARFAYPLQREELYQLPEREDLLVVPRIPPQQGEHIQEC